MVIDGVSQSTGVERVVEVAAAGEGVLLVIRDRVGGEERGRLVAPAEPLITILADRPAGPQVVVGTAAAGPNAITVEVRRNEVLLSVGDADAAVGLDDFMDAVGSAAQAA